MGEIIKFQLENDPTSLVNIFLPANCNWKSLKDLIQIRFNLSDSDEILEVLIIDSATKDILGKVTDKDKKINIPFTSYCLVKLLSSAKSQLPISPISKSLLTPTKSPVESSSQIKSIQPSPIIVPESPEVVTPSLPFIPDFEGEEDIGNTLFHDACLNGQLKCVETLVQSGQDLEVTNSLRQTPFLLTCLHGHLDVAKFLAKSGANVFAEDENWSSAIHYAAQGGYVDLLRWLVETNHDRSITNRMGQKPLDVAKLYKQTDAIEFLSEESNGSKQRIPNSIPCSEELHNGDEEQTNTSVHSSVNVQLSKSSSVTPSNTLLSDSEALFLHACAQGDRAIIISFLENNGNIHCKNDNGSQGIHFLASYGDVSLLRLLLRYDIDIDTINNNKCTALHFACQHSHLEMIQFLITEGNSNVFIENINGMTPIHILCGTSNGYDALIWFIESYPLYFNEFIQQNQLSSYPQIKTLLSSQITLLHVACAASSSKIISCLLDHGFDLTLRDDKSHNVLHIACNEDNIEAVKLICSRASNIQELINATVHDTNITPIFYACLSGSYEIVKYLMKFNPDLTIRNIRGNTCIHAACQSGNIKLVKYLLKKGCSINVVNDTGFWPLDFAIKIGNEGLVNYLKSIYALNSSLYHELEHMTLSNDINRLKQWIREGYDLIPAVYILGYKDHTILNETVYISLLHEICYRGIVDVFNLIFQSPEFTLDIPDQYNRTPLHFLCMCTSPSALQILEAITSLDIFLDPIDSYGYTPFFYACQYGNLLIAQKLINFGCNLYHTGGDNSMTTALHISTAHGHMELIQWLTQSGLNIYSLNENENTPLDIAKFEGHQDIYQWFVTIGSTIHDNRLETSLLPQIIWALDHNYMKFALSTLQEILSVVGTSNHKNFICNLDGSNLLHYSCGCGDLNITRLLISENCDLLHASNHQGYLPLHMACIKGHVTILDYLRTSSSSSCNMKITIKDKIIGNSGFHYACIYNHLNIVQYYCQHGFINMINNDSYHGLHYACQYGYLDIVLLLIEYSNINLNCLNNEKMTPLHLACYYQWDEIIVALIKSRKCNLDLQDQNHLDVPHLITMIGYKPLINWMEHVLSGAAVYPVYQAPQYLKQRGKRLRIGDDIVSETESEDNQHSHHSKSENMEHSIPSSVPFVPNSLFFCVSDTAATIQPLGITKINRRNKSSYPPVGNKHEIQSTGDDGDSDVPMNRSSHDLTHPRYGQNHENSFNELYQSLFESIENHNYDLFCQIFQSNYKNLNFHYCNSLTFNNIFHLISKNNELRILQYMMKYLSLTSSIMNCINSKNINSMTPLHIACEEEYTDLILYLITHCHANLNISNNSSYTPFTILILKKNFHVLKEINCYLAQHCNNSNSSNDDDDQMKLDLSHLSLEQQTYFHIAIHTKSFEIIELIYSFYQQYSSNNYYLSDVVNIIDQDGKSALHYACQFCSYNIVAFLLSNSADISITDNYHCPPVYYAIIAGNLKIVQLLIEKYNNLHCLNDVGDSLLHVACQYGKLVIAKWLVTKGLDMNRKNNDGLTPIECAELSNNKGIAEWARTFQ